jgi:hypothetical protein
MEDKAHQYLVDWIVDFLKNKDLLLKKIELIEKNKDGFDVYIKFRDKEQFFIVKPLTGDIDKKLSKFNEQGHFGLVVFNTKSNFDILIRNWDKIVKFKNLSVYFINPFSQLDKKWIIHPYVHNNICERNALEKGLRSMFEMVEPLTEDNIKDRFK